MGLKNKTKYLTLLITLAGLVILGLALMTVVPKMKLWARTYSNENARYVTLTPGQDASVVFSAPCSTVYSITVNLESVSSFEDPISKIDARIELQDIYGNIIFSCPVNSVYEESVQINNVPLNRGEKYQIVFALDDVEGEAQQIGVGVTGSGDLAIGLRGVNSGVPEKTSFLAAYVIFALLVLVYVYSLLITNPKDIELTGKVLMIAGVAMALVFINQYFDLFIIAKCGLRMIDSVKAGEFFSYYDHAYSAELLSGSPAKFFGYNYNVLTVLPIAVAMIPFSFFADGNIGFGFIGDLAVWYLDIIVAVLIIWSVKLTDRIGKACGMPDEYNRSVKLVYAFSPMLLYISVGFGQIDIIYVILMLFAFPFYYGGKYKMFSFIMAFAVVMKLIPFLIFVPLILLTNKKIKDIFLNTLICLSVKLGISLLFERGTGYDAITNITSDRYDFAGRLFEVGIGGLSLFVMAFAGLCIYCYKKDIDAADKKKLLYISMLVILAVYSAFTAFVDVHQQWLIPLVLSLAFLIPFLGKDKRIIILMGAFEILLIVIHSYILDSVYMIGNGMLSIEDYNYSGITIVELLDNITPVAFPLIRSVIVVLLFGLIVIFARRTPNDVEDELTVDRTLATGRILLLYLYFIFCFWCYCYVG